MSTNRADLASSPTGQAATLGSPGNPREKEQELSLNTATARTKVRAPVAKPLARERGTAKLMDLVTASLEDGKAEDILAIDLKSKSSIADFMVIATGRSNRHVGAIADNLAKQLRASGLARVRIEGMPACDWVLVDAGDVIVHIFRPEVREFYNLEKMWLAEWPAEMMQS